MKAKTKNSTTSTAVLFATIALLVGTLAFASTMSPSLRLESASVLEAISSFFSSAPDQATTTDPSLSK